MSEARTLILGRLRDARRGAGHADEDGRAAVEARLAAHRPNLIPARADLAPEERIQMFRVQAEAVQTEVERVPARAEVPERVAGFLRRHNLPLRLVMAGEPALQELPWAGAMLEVETGRAAEDRDAVGLTLALAGVAETGTVMLRSGAQTPTSLAFLPDTAVVVLATSKVLRAYEDALALLRDEGPLPRSVNFVTGPSRTADIEQTLQLGAHGPRRLLVVLVDEPVAPAG